MRPLFVFLTLLGTISCSTTAVVTKSSNDSFDQKNAISNPPQLKIKHQPPPPPYPEEAKAVGVQGTVIVELIIDPEGIPVSARALSGPSELRKTSEIYSMQWRFFPEQINGKPSYFRFKLTLPYKLN